MPILEAFILGAPELFGAEVAGAEAASALGAEALGAEALGTAALAGELTGLSGVPGALAGAEGITQAQLAADAAAGGAGAGAANINAAQVGAQQAAAQGINAIPQLPMGAEMPGTFVPEPLYSGQGIGQIPAEQFIEAGSGVPYTAENAIAQANLAATATPPSALEVGMDKAMKFAEKNPFTAMTAAYMGANALGLLNPSGATFNNAPYSGPLSKYFLSPNFQGRTANPADFQYKPRYAEGGGIMSPNPMMNNNIPVGYDDGGAPGYAKGGSLADSISSYQRMLSGNTPAAPAASHDVGIYYDLDPDTRYQDALTAAQIRQAKVNQRAYTSAPVAKRPTPMGQLKLPTSGKGQSGGDVEAAQGGIMQAYAAGGVTGSGNLDLHIPLDLGGGGGGATSAAGGYTPAGGGGGQDYGTFGGNSSGGGGVLQQIMGALGGGGGGMPMPLVPRAAPAMTQYMPQQGMAQPPSTGNSMFDALAGYAQPPKTQSSRPNYPANTSGQQFSGRPMYTFAQGGGISSLGGYAAGGNPRLLKGPGDGMSDNIPATINGRQPARLADGEFVIPADVVSHLGNGSTDAGAKQLHAMMDKVRKARTGNPKQGKEINPKKYMPK